MLCRECTKQKNKYRSEVFHDQLILNVKQVVCVFSYLIAAVLNLVRWICKKNEAFIFLAIQVLENQIIKTPTMHQHSRRPNNISVESGPYRTVRISPTGTKAAQKNGWHTSTDCSLK